jgi:thiamine biosynthesis lipoprotein
MFPPLARRNPAVAEQLLTPDGLARHSFEAMGTTVVVLVPLTRVAECLRVQDLFARWERACTRFDPQSELSQLNAAGGQPFHVSDLLFSILVTSQQAAEATNGLFDPSLLRSLEWIGYDRDFDVVLAEQPGSSRAGPPPAAGGWREMRLDHDQRTVQLPADVGLDLGGLAKGMAVDAAIDGLASSGVGIAAVDAGGDLAVIGLPPGASAWSIAINAPDGSRIVSLVRGALATSSTSPRKWLQGEAMRHHLIDPRTSLPSTAPLWSASAAAPTCSQAEVAAKVAFILGPLDGAEFLEEHGLAGLFLAPDGTARTTGGWTSG